MPDLEWNRETWNQQYDWSERGAEWSRPWGSVEAQWFGSIFPRIHTFLPAARTLELAPGFGRWTRFLIPLSRDYLGVDLSGSCISHCRTEFRTASNARFEINDGRALPMVDDASCDFVFSFDSLVHAEIDVVTGYVGEILRVLTDSGVAFIHHSNSAGVGAPENEHHRAASVSAALVRDAIARSGGRAWLQELIGWVGPTCIDALTLFGRAPAGDQGSPVLIENPDYMEEARLIRTYQDPWNSARRTHAE